MKFVVASDPVVKSRCGTQTDSVARVAAVNRVSWDNINNSVSLEIGSLKLNTLLSSHCIYRCSIISTSLGTSFVICSLKQTA